MSVKRNRIVISLSGGGTESYVVARLIADALRRHASLEDVQISSLLAAPRSLTSSEIKALISNYDFLIREDSIYAAHQQTPNLEEDHTKVQGLFFHLEQWVFCNAVLQQIKKIENGRIMEVYDGYGGTAGDLTDRCFPVTVVNKRASETAINWISSFATSSVKGLNTPAVVEEVRSIWADICACKEGSIEQKQAFTSLDEFCMAINGRLSEINNAIVCPPSGRTFKLIV